MCLSVLLMPSNPQNLDLLEPHNLIPNGVWTLDGLLRYGEQHKQCPYFTSRRMVRHFFSSGLCYSRLLTVA